MPRTKRKNRFRKNVEKKSDAGGAEPEIKSTDGERDAAGHDKPRGYSLVMKQNEAFENYYKTLGIVPEGEWDSFMEHLKLALPATFRVAGFRGQARELVKLIKGEYLNSVVDLSIDGKKLEAPKCLPWYPDELAWQLNLDRSYIRKSDAMKKLHTFLVSETESGNISRQEAVSMLPPLVLDIKPHHKILDMCAAPGSKTSQLIEMLHADESVHIPDGFVVANDSDNKRCYLMVHQVKRLESPNFMIINHDASQLPNMRFNTEERKSWVNYDRVLCDVPCSGDGTVRKNPDVWGKWNAGAGLNLHGLQCRILKRGIELLAVGGRLVYSTCSFNPVENEAVVAHLLEKCKGAVKLVDVSDTLPGLKYGPGLKTWKVMTRNQTWYEKAEDVPISLATQVRPTMFPPTLEEAERLNLDRCLRILPHHQNTGGFFLAVFEKTCQVGWFKGKPQPVAERVTVGGNGVTEVGEVSKSPKPDGGPGTDGIKDTDKNTVSDGTSVTDGNVAGVSEADGTGGTVGTEGTDGTGEIKAEEASGEKMEAQTDGGMKRKTDTPWSNRPPKKSKLRGYKEDPFVWLTEEDPVWPPIREFYGIEPAFRPDLLMVRCAEGKKRNLYYTSDAIKKLVQHNSDRVKFINMGVKVFARSDSAYVNCDFRLVNDGISVIYPFITKRVAEILPEDIVTILVQDNPYLVSCSQLARKNIEPLDQGGLVYVCKPDGGLHSPGCQIILTGWKGRVSTRSFLRKFERAHYLRLCGAELEPKVQNKSKEAAKEKVEVDTESPGAVDGDEETGGTHKDIEKVDDQDIENGDKQKMKSETSSVEITGKDCDSEQSSTNMDTETTTEAELCEQGNVDLNKNTGPETAASPQQESDQTG